MSMSLSDPSVKEFFFNKNAQDVYVGKEFTVRFLTSAKGQTLNGRRCKAIGFGNRRIQIKMLDDGSTVTVKARNLLPVDVSIMPSFSGAAMTTEAAQSHLARAFQYTERENANTNRQDMQARMALVRSLQGKLPEKVECMDPLIPESERDEFTNFMQDMRTCCCGDNTVDFHHFNEGMAGLAQDTACPVCLDVIPATAPGLLDDEAEGGDGDGDGDGVERRPHVLGFPCGHVFHYKCASDWLDHNNTCPTCRFQLGMPGYEYRHVMSDQAKKIQLRFREWFISGMCQRCQAKLMESDPLCSVPLPDGSCRLVPRSQLGDHAFVDDVPL